MRPFYNYLVRSNFYIAFSAISLYLYYALTNSISYSVQIILLIFSLVFLGYNALRVSAWKLKGKYIGHENIRFYYKNSKSLIALFVITFLLVIYTSLSLTPSQWYYLIGALSLFLIYENPILKFNLRSTYLKPIVIGLAWSLTITGLSEDINLFSFIDCFLFIAILSLAFDVKSKETDTKEGLRTLAQLRIVSPKKIINYLYISYAISNFIWSCEMFFLISIPIFWFLNKNQNLNYLYFAIGIDGLMILRLFLYIFQNQYW